MAAFSYQQQFQPFMLDPLVSPHTPYDSSFTTLNSMFSPSDQVIIHQSCSNNPDDVPNVMNCPDQDSRNGYNGVTFENMTYVTGKQSIIESSSAVVDDKFEEAEPASQRLIPMTRKRKSRNGSCSSSAQSKDTRKVRSRKQKNCNKEEIKDKKREEKNSEKGTEEQPKDYVHVRARRGQATNSHSLAERVRRERISERMKILQQLVPGCDKVTGKALMLDEIINYVQSLHNQVEFLSMRLASLSSLIYECGVDLDGFMVRPEGLARFEPAEMPPVQQMGPLMATSAFTDVMATSAFTDVMKMLLCTKILTEIGQGLARFEPAEMPPVQQMGPLMATSAFTDVMANNPYPSTLLHDPSLLLLPQSNNPLQVPAQIHGNEMREVEGEKRQKYVHPTGFTNNLCSFH